MNGRSRFASALAAVRHEEAVQRKRWEEQHGKECNTCHLTKPTTEFYVEPRATRGYSGRCMVCTRAIVTQNRVARRTKAAAMADSMFQHLIGSGVTIKPGESVAVPTQMPTPTLTPIITPSFVPTPTLSAPPLTTDLTLQVWLEGGGSHYAEANDRMFVVPGRLVVERVRGRYTIWQRTTETTPGRLTTDMDSAAVRTVLAFIAPGVLAMTGEVYKL
jgi:hypothetical protein